VSQHRQPYVSLEDRLLSNIVHEDNGYEIDGQPSECWLWIGNVDHKGYGCLSMRLKPGANPTRVRAHRASYEHFMGIKLAEGVTLDHRCRVHACIHPNHLAPETRAENTRLMRRYWAKRSAEEAGQMEMYA
jgi:hypothetical protein